MLQASIGHSKTSHLHLFFWRPEAESLEEELQLVEAKARNKNQLAKVLLTVCPVHARQMPPHPVWQPNGESSRVNWKSLRQACA